MPTPEARSEAIHHFADEVHGLGANVTVVADELKRDRKTRTFWTRVIVLALVASLITNVFAVRTATGNRERTKDIKSSLIILRQATGPDAQKAQADQLSKLVQDVDQRERDALNEEAALQAVAHGQDPPPTLAPAKHYEVGTTTTTRPSPAPTTTAGQSSGPSTTRPATTTTTSTATTQPSPTTQPATTVPPSTTTTRCTVNVTGTCLLR